MHVRGPKAQMLANFIIRSQPEHRFLVETEKCIVFKGYIDRCARLQECLVEDLDAADVVIDRVIFIFFEQLSAGCYANRTRWNIKCTE